VNGVNGREPHLSLLWQGPAPLRNGAGPCFYV
jgi:hypothetical protein